MPITIDELNEKYKKEDKTWDFKSFFTWLTKKGIPPPIINAALKKALTDYSQDNLPDDHHTFDNTVLLLAKILNEDSETMMAKALEESYQDSLKNYLNIYDADWNKLTKWQKIKQVLQGKA